MDKELILTVLLTCIKQKMKDLVAKWTSAMMMSLEDK